MAQGGLDGGCAHRQQDARTPDGGRRACVGSTGRAFRRRRALHSSLPRRRRYRRAQAIGIMNYWVMFNQNPVIDSADLLVIDDAHLAEAALDSLFSVEVDRYAHPAMFDALVRALAEAFPDYATFQDAVADVPSRAGTELLSFLDQSAFVDRLSGIIDAAAELRTDDDLRFRWQRVRTRLHEVNLYANTRSLWMRPYVYPLRDNDRYADPQQRIYMSATIGDPADLARRLGTLPIVKLPVSAEQSAQTYGRRLLVLNPDDPATIPGRLDAVILAALRIQPKSLWLCSSKSDAERFRQAVTEWLGRNGFASSPSWLLSSLGDELDHFKSAEVGHLFVAGRFDGIRSPAVEASDHHSLDLHGCLLQSPHNVANGSCRAGVPWRSGARARPVKHAPAVAVFAHTHTIIT
jgi:hypothetical protein